MKLMEEMGFGRMLAAMASLVRPSSSIRRDAEVDQPPCRDQLCALLTQCEELIRSMGLEEEVKASLRDGLLALMTGRGEDDPEWPERFVLQAELLLRLEGGSALGWVAEHLERMLRQEGLGFRVAGWMEEVWGDCVRSHLEAWAPYAKWELTPRGEGFWLEDVGGSGIKVWLRPGWQLPEDADELIGVVMRAYALPSASMGEEAVAEIYFNALLPVKERVVAEGWRISGLEEKEDDDLRHLLSLIEGKGEEATSAYERFCLRELHTHVYENWILSFA